MPLIRKDPGKTEPGSEAGNKPEGLNSPSEDARWTAARQLSKDPQSVGALASALALEVSPRVREAILTSLARIQTPEAVAAILPYIRSEDAAIRSGALDALSAMPGIVEKHLPSLMADPDPDVRLLICDIVRRLPADVAVACLCDLLDSEDQINVSAAAVEALSEVGDERALPALARCAARFHEEPFLQFSIQAVSNRITGNGPAREPRKT